MLPWLVVPLIAAASIALLWLGRWATRLSLAQSRPVLFQQLTYQPLSLVLAVIVLFVARGVSGDPGGNLVQAGNLSAPTAGLWLLGVSDTDNWITVGLTFLIVMTLVTGLTMWWQLGRRSGVRFLDLLVALPWAISFAAVNALTEELLFRVTLVESLSPLVAPWLIAVVGALIFGIPHYFGKPGGALGVVLAGFMGWLLTLSLIQTGGMAWAYVIHFAQDIVIITLLLAVSERRSGRPRFAL